MFAARANQENTIYEQQQAAAAKPLNQGVKGLAPKTPANKPQRTLLGKARNDENTSLTLAKGEAKLEQLQWNAFVTPANPHLRAPLGNKTTNAKALQTPAALWNRPKDGDKPSSTKPTSPRLRRSRIKVHDSPSADAHHVLPQDPLPQDAEEREIEYMPPRETPLPEDFDDIWPHDCDYSMLQGKNLTRGWWSEFAPQKDEDDSELSDFDENCRRAEALNKKATTNQKPLARKAPKSFVPGTGLTLAASRNAATALGAQTSKSTAATVTSSRVSVSRQRQPVSSTAKKPILDLGNPRFAAAKVASNTTIGYSKGRVVSSSRRPVTDIYSQSQNVKHKESAENKTNLDHLLSLGSLEIADDDSDLGFSGPRDGLDSLLEDDDEPQVFQLDPPAEP